MMINVQYSDLLEALPQHEEYGVHQVSHLVEKVEIGKQPIGIFIRMVRRKNIHAAKVIRFSHEKIFGAL